jgi:hypothetical protein
LHERRTQWLYELGHAYRARKTKYRISYPKVPALSCKIIWNHYATFNFVADRHVKFLDDMKESCMEVVALMTITNELWGRTQWRIDDDEFLDAGITKRMQPYFEDWVDGFYMSDFGFPMLDYTVCNLAAATTPEKVLIGVDRMFNVWHGSGPLADRFIEGGMKTLNSLKFSTAE